MTFALVTAIVLLQVADGWTTWAAITRGVGHESNRLVRALMDRVGVVGALLILKGWAAVFIVVGQALHWWQGQAAQLGLAALMIFYAVVVANNFKVLRGG